MAIRQFFQTESSDSEAHQIAIAVLLFRLVRSDGNTKMLELMHMSELLRKEFSLTQQELELVFKKASIQESKGINLDEFMREACDNLNNQKRIKMVEFLWILAFSDDQIEKQEVSLIRNIAQQLKLTELEQATAQENAEKHLGLDLF